MTQDKQLEVGYDKDLMYWSGAYWYTPPAILHVNNKKKKLIGAGKTKQEAITDLNNQKKLYDRV